MHRHFVEGRLRAIMAWAILIGCAWAALPDQRALGLITGGEGNKPLTIRGWPEGTAEIFNHPSRIAWWEGPPYGGGQWHAEYRSDTEALNIALKRFAELDVANKRLVIHDGTGSSFWLNPNGDPSKASTAAIDWSFSVWEPEKWDQLRKLPVGISPIDQPDEQAGPPAQVDIYTGGSIDWSETDIPEGIEVVDRRLEAHGYTTDDGTVLEGKVTDVRTGQAIRADVELQEIQPQRAGGYRYPMVAETQTDDGGHWVLKMTPPGWYRVVARSEGYAPRIAGFGRFDDQPRWHSYDARLASAASLSGRVTDEQGQALSRVEVRLANVVARDDRHYRLPQDHMVQTDADGRFRFEDVPEGEATIQLRKTGYVRPGLGLATDIPARNIELSMTQSASVRVTVSFADAERPAEYIVETVPEGGEAVGKWSGSGKIDENNQILFQDVPPGTYLISGRPNPSSAGEQTRPQKIVLKGGQTLDFSLTPRSDTSLD